LAKKKNEEVQAPLKRKPWIEKNKGLRIITIVSISLALWVGFQIVRTENDWGMAILWGAIFGGSTWLVFLGMNAFHSLFNREKRD
jgi:hypothetical protein